MIRTLACPTCHARLMFTVVPAAPGLLAPDDDCALWVAGSTFGCATCEAMGECVATGARGATGARAAGPTEDHARSVVTRIFGGTRGVSTAPLS